MTTYKDHNGNEICELCFCDASDCECSDNRKPGFYEIDGKKFYYRDAPDTGSADRTTERGDNG